MRVVLSDREEKFVGLILDKTDWQIALLIVDDISPNLSFYSVDRRIDKVVTLSQLMQDTQEENIDLDVINTYKYAFSLSDYGSRRLRDDLNFCHYEFYTSIIFWHDFFLREKIDTCIITNHFHGFRCDYILQEVSKRNQVPCYNIFYHNYDKLALYSADENNLLEICDHELDVDNEGIYQTAYYAQIVDWNAGFYDSAKLSSRILFKLGGVELFRFVWLLKNGETDIHYRKCNAWSYLNTFERIKRTLRGVQKLYTPPQDDDKFVIYFLHLEPEAVITSFASTVDSQLVYIRMLSKALPEGWKLYVKEHPDTYKINQWGFEHNVPCMPTFITSYFYETIAEMENVQLIDYRIPASDLLQKAKAISTIAGTIALEAVLKNKPIILFETERLLYHHCSDFLFVRNLEACKEALHKVENGFVPDYTDYYELQSRFLVKDSQMGRELLLKKIAECMK